MLLKRKKTSIVSNKLSSKRFWALASLRRQSKKKGMVARIRRSNSFYSLKLLDNPHSGIAEISLVDQGDKP